MLVCFKTAYSQTNNGNDDDVLGIHKVEKGETLYRISRNFFLTEKDIYNPFYPSLCEKYSFGFFR